jgi:hypothetical protein
MGVPKKDKGEAQGSTGEQRCNWCLVQQQQRAFFKHFRHTFFSLNDVQLAEAYYAKAVSLCRGQGWPYTSIRVRLEAGENYSRLRLFFDGHQWRVRLSRGGGMLPLVPYAQLQASLILEDLAAPESFNVVKMGTTGIRTRYRFPWVTLNILGMVEKRRALYVDDGAPGG